MNLNEFKKLINSVSDEFDDYTVVKSQAMPECRIDKIIKVIYI